MTTVTEVTLSDCGKALDTIAREMEKLERDATAIRRRIEALRTQGLLIKELARKL